MLISQADAKQLKRRKQALHDHEALQHAELLRVLCTIRVLQLLSDGVGAFDGCPSKACRRRHRCRGMPFRCLPVMCERGISHDPVHLIDALYWLVLQAMVDEGEADVRP